MFMGVISYCILVKKFVTTQLDLYKKCDLADWKVWFVKWQGWDEGGDFTWL